MNNVILKSSCCRADVVIMSNGYYCGDCDKKCHAIPDDVFDLPVEGLSDEYRKGYQDGFAAGFKKATITEPEA